MWWGGRYVDIAVPSLFSIVYCCWYGIFYQHPCARFRPFVTSSQFIFMDPSRHNAYMEGFSFMMNNTSASPLRAGFPGLARTVNILVLPPSPMSYLLAVGIVKELEEEYISGACRLECTNINIISLVFGSSSFLFHIVTPIANYLNHCTAFSQYSILRIRVPGTFLLFVAPLYTVLL